MTFPVEFHIGSLRIPAHTVLEVIAYTAGFQAYLLIRRRNRDSGPRVDQSAWVICGAICGAFLGSKLLVIAESWPAYLKQFRATRDPALWLSGKTVVGGLLGGWIGVEIAKRCVGVAQRTGDSFVIPLAIGIAVGRVGCFLTGLEDHTHGVATNLPWAVDFGDGIPRHPAQLYEIAFVITWTAAISLAGARRRPGGRFRLFLLGYLLFRFAVEFIKPTLRMYGGLSAIQWASLAGAAVCAWQLSPRGRGSTGGSGQLLRKSLESGPSEPIHRS